MSGLKPCPFCGHEAHYSQTIFQSKIVACNYCNARTIGCSTDELAAMYWNRRIGNKKTKSLTIKKLKMMVGEPVFVISGNKEEWCIVHSYHLPEVVGGGIIVTTRTSQKKTLPYNECGFSWLAYDRKVEDL